MTAHPAHLSPRQKTLTVDGMKGSFLLGLQQVLRAVIDATEKGEGGNLVGDASVS